MKFGVKEVMDVTFYELTTGKPTLFVDTLKISNMENTAETVFARGGKGNPKLLVWDFGRESTMQIQDALLSMRSISILAGQGGVVGVGTGNTIHKREQIVSVAGTPTIFNLTETPVAGTVTSVYRVIDGSDAAVETPFTHTAATKVVTITGATAGQVYAIYYQYAAPLNAQVVTLTANNFPGFYKVVGDTVVRNAVTGVDEPFQLVIPKAKIQPGFTLSFQAEGDPTVFDMNLEVFQAPGEDAMVKMIKY